jgi:hypothetical protein
LYHEKREEGQDAWVPFWNSGSLWGNYFGGLDMACPGRFKRADIRSLTEGQTAGVVTSDNQEKGNSEYAVDL